MLRRLHSISHIYFG